MPLPQLLLEEFEGLRISFWALFGAFSILTHKIFYVVVDLLSLLGAAGLLVFLAKHRRNQFTLSVISFLSILLAIGSAMLIGWTMQTSASTGRLLFPYITSISLLLAMGLYALRIPALLVAVLLFLFTVAAPIVYIIPNYDHPPIVDKLPAHAIETSVRWGEISLVGYELPPPQRWSAGDEIPLTLYWQPLAQSTELHALFLTLLDADQKAIATIDTFPGWGRLPTMWWEPGDIYQDDYILQIPPDAEGYTTVQLHFGWYPFPDGSDIQPVLESGEQWAEATLPLGAFVAGEPSPSLGADATADGTVFGDAIQLIAYRFGEGHVLELEWQIVGDISGEWRVFAIVLSEPYQSGSAVEVLWQRDNVPAVSVNYLTVGETFVTRHDFELPAGYGDEHGIYVGWYNEDMGERLPVPYPSNMLELPRLQFRSPAA